MVELIAIMIWTSLGASGFTYWYAGVSKFGLDWFFWLLLPLTTLIGPFAWLLGWTLHGQHE